MEANIYNLVRLAIDIWQGNGSLVPLSKFQLLPS
jgi:hypothetical protein